MQMKLRWELQDVSMSSDALMRRMKIILLLMMLVKWKKKRRRVIRVHLLRTLHFRRFPHTHLVHYSPHHHLKGVSMQEWPFHAHFVVGPAWWIISLLCFFLSARSAIDAAFFGMRGQTNVRKKNLFFLFVAHARINTWSEREKWNMKRRSCGARGMVADGINTRGCYVCGCRRGMGMMRWVFLKNCVCVKNGSECLSWFCFALVGAGWSANCKYF